jgi:iron complex outermembrane receptor protein
MKKILLPLLLVIFSNLSFSQHNGSVSGKVTDKQTNEVLQGATVSIKGTAISAVTNNEGNFIIKEKLNPGKIVLEISYVGYETKEIAVTITDEKLKTVNADLIQDERIGNAVVVSALKRREKITNAPASIQVIGTKDLTQFAGSNVNELVSQIQGIEYTRNGVDEITFNARGFNSAFNIRVLQLVDSRNSMSAISGGLPVFNNGSTNKDDIERVEIIQGPQSALYGPNAHNALFNYITKDPRRYQGTTVSVSAGSQYQFSSRFRHALKINNKWAYKLTGEHATGKDYQWHDLVYAGNQNPPATIPFGPPVAIPERIHDFTFRRFRGEAHVYYSITPKADIIVSGGGSKFSRLGVTTALRNQVRDATYSFLQARLVHPHFFATLYNTWSNSGRTTVLGAYTRDYWNRTHSTITDPRDSLRYRLPPDSAEIFASRLGNTTKERSQRLNAEAQYNTKFEKAGLSLVAGLSYQLERPNAFGITLVDSFQKIRITQYGAVVQLEKFLPWSMRFISTTRFDHHSNFGNFFAPRFAFVKVIADGAIRITWGKAYSMPSILNQYAGIARVAFGNGGGIKYIRKTTN